MKIHVATYVVRDHSYEIAKINFVILTFYDTDRGETTKGHKSRDR